MSVEMRWSLSELLRSYTLEPHLQDVFVEGECDVPIVRWFLDQHGCKDVRVICINRINVPTQEVISRKLNDGNKGRVVALAMILANRFPRMSRPVVCIADSDTDIYLGKLYDCQYLLLTDHTSMEMYLFDETLLDKYLTLYLRHTSMTGRSLLTNIVDALEDLFLYRLSNDVLGLSIKQVSFDKSCRIQHGKVVFDRSDYLDRWLTAHRRTACRNQVETAIEELRKKRHTDRRDQIHGHDFVSLLAWYLKSQRFKHTEHCGGDSVTRELSLCLDSVDLARQPMFSSLLNRAGATQG